MTIGEMLKALREAQPEWLEKGQTLIERGKVIHDVRMAQVTGGGIFPEVGRFGLNVPETILRNTKNETIVQRVLKDDDEDEGRNHPFEPPPPPPGEEPPPTSSEVTYNDSDTPQRINVDFDVDWTAI